MLLRWSVRKRKVKIGGVAFFFSYVFSLPLALIGLSTAHQVISTADSFTLWLLLAGLLLGWWFGYTLLRGQISVLIHEYKHALLALLVGNKWKKLKLKGMSGSFQYSYTQDTAEYNAFISLAPYFLPVITFIGLLLYPILHHANTEGALLFLAAIHGTELYLQLKDATPIQTDLTGIKGGYFVALGYIFAANACITSLLILWLVGGNDGLQIFGQELYQCGLLVVATVRAIFIP